MRVVLDTNVLVSALLKPGSVPARVVEATLGGVDRIEMLCDARILAEYHAVLERPKFRAIPREAIATLLQRIEEHARSMDLSEDKPGRPELPDEDDRIFVEVALAGRADAVVTGNLADFPLDLGFEVLPPATFLARIEAASGSGAGHDWRTTISRTKSS
jgi:uncharacterized protein